MIYVASPYSHPLFFTRETRYKATLRYVAHLVNSQLFPFSPIVHMHQVAFFHELPTDFVFWRSYNEHMLQRSTAVHVLKLEGWEDSVGIKNEIDFATGLCIPVTYITP